MLATSHSLVSEAIITGPTEGLTVPLLVAAVAGAAMALPIVLWQVWGFLRPALTPAERHVAAPVIASGVLLFAAGAAFAYWVLPVGLGFLATFLGGNATYLPDITAMVIPSSHRSARRGRRADRCRCCPG